MCSYFTDGESALCNQPINSKEEEKNMVQHVYIDNDEKFEQVTKGCDKDTRDFLELMYKLGVLFVEYKEEE